MQSGPPATFWETLAEYPLFVLQLFASPRALVRSADWSDAAQLRRLSLYALLSCAILVLAFGNFRSLAEREKPRLSSFKGIVMRAHDRSWDWLEPVYAPLNVSQGEAKRLWDNLLMPGFLAFTFFAAMLAVALIARLRMLRFSLSWNHALGTAILGLLPCMACLALSLVPLMLLLICRHCGVRLALFILLNLTGWAYLGYYTLADLGERPGGLLLLAKSLGYGLLQFVLAYIVFFVLILCVIPV